jgi:tetratricopeptide (TPR) repeat protein
LVERLLALDPTNAVGRNARAEIAHGLSEDQARQIERDGLAAFYRGQYQRALDTLGKVAADVKTPRIVFYQACSTAALGLIQNDKAKLQKAHELFQQARPKDNPFTVERKYISPRITQVLDATS